MYAVSLLLMFLMVFVTFFLTHFSDFMKEMEWLEKAETEDVVKGLDEWAQKLDMIAAFIFILIDVKGKSGSKQQQP